MLVHYSNAYGVTTLSMICSASAANVGLFQRVLVGRHFGFNACIHVKIKLVIQLNIDYYYTYHIYGYIR